MQLKAASKHPSIWRIARETLWEGGPGVCHFSITNACNARCAFCSFAHDVLPTESRRWVTLSDAREACNILRRNGIRVLHFNGGEATVHPDLTAMVAHAAQIGMMTVLDTNGALLTPKRIDALVDAGLAKVCISIDAASSVAHDSNRGIPGLSKRIRCANARLKRRGIATTASVTMSRLVDYAALPDHLQALGFGAVTFSYPQRTLPSSYLAHREDSSLVDFTPEELHAAFEAVKAVSKRFPVHNPVASIEDMQRHLRGEREVFGCLGGWKYFYLDWDLKIWRCHHWDRPLCHIRDFDATKRVRDGCTACMIDCFRDDSVMQHVGVALSDGLRAAARGDIRQAWSHWTDRRNVVSLRAAIPTARRWARTA